MITTSVYGSNLRAFNRGKRYIVNQGGQSSSKTYSLLQLILNIALKATGNRWISIVSETLPHLKKGAMRDFQRILEDEGLYSESIHNKTDNIYSITSACDRYTSQIEFFGADSHDKVRGPRRDYLYINECNNVSYEVFYHLASRTRKVIFLDFNPVQEFWVHNKLLPTLTDAEYEFIKSTYRDNQMLSDAEKSDIERRALVDANFKRVYADGEIGNVDGLIFQNYELVDDMPVTDKRRIGIDFGFTNDPTSIIDVRLFEGDMYVDEVCYRKGMLNGDISAVLKSLNLDRSIRIIPDSAEPKSIEELRLMGHNVFPAVKGADSIRSGIATLHQYKVYVTKRSVNVLKELRNYQWDKAKDGTILNTPAPGGDHAIDAWRYGGTDLVHNKPLKNPSFSFGK